MKANLVNVTAEQLTRKLEKQSELFSKCMSTSEYL